MTTTALTSPDRHATLCRALFLSVPALIAAAVFTAVLLASGAATMEPQSDTASQTQETN